MNRLTTILACFMLMAGAAALPVAAHDGDEAHNEKHQAKEDKREQAKERKDAAREKADERKEQFKAEKENRSAEAKERKAEAEERREMMKEKMAERKAAFHEAHAACKDQKNATENFSQGQCVKLAAHTHLAKEKRAEHYEVKMEMAIEKRLAKLDQLEAKVEERIASGLNETELAEAEAKLERIQEARDRLEEKLARINGEDSSDASEEGTASGDDAEGTSAGDDGLEGTVDDGAEGTSSGDDAEGTGAGDDA